MNAHQASGHGVQPSATGRSTLEPALGAHREWLRSAGAAGERIELRNKNLSGVDLSGIDLRRADFEGCQLFDTDFRFCWLDFSDLRGGQIRQARIDENTRLPTHLNCE